MAHKRCLCASCCCVSWKGRFLACCSRSAVHTQWCRLHHAVAHRTVFSLDPRRVRAADAHRVAESSSCDHQSNILGSGSGYRRATQTSSAAQDGKGPPTVAGGLVFCAQTAGHARSWTKSLLTVSDVHGKTSQLAIEGMKRMKSLAMSDIRCVRVERCNFPHLMCLFFN